MSLSSYFPAEAVVPAVEVVSIVAGTNVVGSVALAGTGVGSVAIAEFSDHNRSPS